MAKSVKVKRHSRVRKGKKFTVEQFRRKPKPKRIKDVKRRRQEFNRAVYQDDQGRFISESRWRKSKSRWR